MCSKTQPLENAHVNRKGYEAIHYYQHPHNLLVMCSNCHGRYDTRTDPHLTHQVISYRKGVLQQQLLAAIDRDHQVVLEVERLLAPLRPLLAQLGSQSFWANPAGAQTLQSLANLSTSLGVVPPAQSGLAQLQGMSRAFDAQYPVAAAMFTSLVHGQGSEAETWDALDEGPPDPGYCARGDGMPALVSQATCPKCETDDYSMSNEEPTRVDDEDGQLVAYFLNADDEPYTPACKSCGHSPLAYELRDLCSYCEHMTSKYADD